MWEIKQLQQSYSSYFSPITLQFCNYYSISQYCDLLFGKSFHGWNQHEILLLTSCCKLSGNARVPCNKKKKKKYKKLSKNMLMCVWFDNVY